MYLIRLNEIILVQCIYILLDGFILVAPNFGHEIFTCISQPIFYELM